MNLASSQRSEYQRQSQLAGGKVERDLLRLDY